MAKKTDDLADLLLKKAHLDHKQLDDVATEIPVRNHLAESVAEIEAEPAIGRPKVKEEDKANQRVVGYVTKADKTKFNEKRGMISESKIIAALISKWLDGEVNL